MTSEQTIVYKMGGGKETFSFKVSAAAVYFE